MIEVFQGRIGGGKTYYAMQRILHALCQGRPVATNINLQVDKIVDYMSRKRYIIDPAQIIIIPDDTESVRRFYEFCPQGSLVVIDEAHIHISQGDSSELIKKNGRQLLEFLTLSRHQKTDIIFISQHIKNMWNQTARLCQLVYETRDLQRWGIPVTFALFSFSIPWIFGPHTSIKKYDYSGDKLDGWLERRDSALFELYASPERAFAFTRGEIAFNAPEIRREKEVMTAKQSVIMLSLAFVIGMAFNSLVGCRTLGSNGENLKEETEQVAIHSSVSGINSEVEEVEEKGDIYGHLRPAECPDYVWEAASYYIKDGSAYVWNPNTSAFEDWPLGYVRAIVGSVR